MKRFVGKVVGFLFLVSSLSSQILGNEWIYSNATYLKLLVVEEGVYRVRASDLSPYLTSPVDPNNFKLYYRGVEQRIYVYDRTNPGVFDADDYFEFYGKPNDGMDEREMYRDPITGALDPDEQPDSLYSLFSDTAVYFLTWSVPGSSARYSEFAEYNFAAYPPLTYYKEFKYTGYHNRFFPGVGSLTEGINYIKNPHWIRAEGYIGNTFTTPQTLYLNVSGKANVGGTVIVRVRLTGLALGQYSCTITLTQFGLSQTISVPQSTYEPYLQTVTFSIPSSSVTGSQIQVVVTPNNNVPHALCWISVEYDHSFDMGGSRSKVLPIPNVNNAKSVVQLQNIGVLSSDSIWAYDLTAGFRIYGQKSGNQFSFVVPKYSGTDYLIFTTESAVRSPIIRPANIQGYGSPNAGAEFVIITHPSLLPSAEAYRIYRDTNSVNRYSARVYDVTAIYDEFGFGVPTPLAIQRFVRAALSRWIIKPKFIFLWGKGHYLIRNNPANLVPTWGQPASDILFVSNWDSPGELNPVPKVPIGRVNVMNNEEGFAYLNKVMEYEHTPYQVWMKNGIHLGGGKTAYEQNSIGNYLKGWQSMMEGIPFIGNVFYHQKTSSVTSQTISDSIKTFIANGVTLITFFGHSSTNIYDVDLGPAYEYENFGKYPLIYANGCYGGNFAINGKSFGEEWITQPNRGAIGYIGSSGAGYLFYLGVYGNQFYKVVFQDSLGVPIGNQLAEVIRRYWSLGGSGGGRQLYFNHAAINNLQGDPALILYHPRGPDLALYQEGIRFLPANLNAQMDSIEIQITIFNEGLVVEDSFRLAISQFSYGTGQTYFHDTLRLPPFYTSQKTISVKIPVVSPQISGLNTFSFFVDSDQEINEINENNNRVQVDLYIPSNIPAILYPYKFAVINRRQISLKASTYTPWDLTPVAYEFEIDTVRTFDSPFKKHSGVIQATAALGEWQLPFLLEDSMVYYWRVRLVGNAASDWEVATFQYIDGPYQGWAQAKRPQFQMETQYHQMNLNPVSLQWEFLSKAIHIRAASSTTLELFVNNELAYNPFTSYGKDIYVAVFNRNSLDPQLGYDDQVRYVGFLFPQEKAQLTSFLLQVNPGDYVLVGGVNGINPALIDDALWAAFKEIGVSQALKYANGEVNFVVLGKKGSAPGSAIESVMPAPQKATIETYLYTMYKDGKLISPVFGPAGRWDQLLWKWHSEGIENGDQAYLTLYGYRYDGTKVLLKDSILLGSHDLSWIDAETYPRLQIVCHVQDSIYRTSPQIDYWYLLGQAVPEATVSPTIHLVFHKDTLVEGENAFLSLAITNLSYVDMDSILVRYEVLTSEGSVKWLGEKRYAPLKAQDTDTIQYTFSTDGLNKQNTLIVKLNPDYDQPEYSLHNNVLRYPFYVKRDHLNPLLDVTFDGKHIMDGDIVSPNPEILIEVNDENPYYLIDDTSMIVVYMKREEEFGPPPRVFYGSGKLAFQPATTVDNRARVVFRPGPLEDGVYVLEVQGYDKKGNPAGVVPYSIRFRVINESAISHVVNYPNPFSTSTRFVYTLTGSVLPEVFQIHIYTVSGRLVKVIDLVELGEVRIGRNITDYAWDGTDEYGDPLANGVYLYRVVVKMPNDAPISTYKEGDTDRFFKSGWGKMYIMR